MSNPDPNSWSLSCFEDHACLAIYSLLFLRYSGMSVSGGSLVKQGEREEEGAHYKAVMKAVEIQDLQSVSWIPWGQLWSLILKIGKIQGINTNLKVGIVKTAKMDIQSNSEEENDWKLSLKHSGSRNTLHLWEGLPFWSLQTTLGRAACYIYSGYWIKSSSHPRGVLKFMSTILTKCLNTHMLWDNCFNL